MTAAPSTPPPPPAGPCRYCGEPSYIADDLGAVHLCCRSWRRVIKAGFACPSCQIARIVARTGRLPSQPPKLPTTLPDGSPFVPEIDEPHGLSGTRDE